MKVMRRLPAILLLVLAAPSHAAGDVPTRVDIDYDVFRLDNGLTTIVHTDRSVPTVFVGMWYAVGSKDEPEGKTGFAHLFEHLMFQGTENRDGEYFSPFTDAGATGMNGTTAEDRTNYYATVPTGALDMALWMESDRMSHLLGAITQDALDEQRGVVQNEKRQGETQPYAKMWDMIREGLYPVDHPYRHSVIGSMDDLDAASLDDVKDWFRTYYGASNVVLVLAGDVGLDEAKEKVGRYFGSAPVGEPLSQAKQWVPELPANRIEEAWDKVGQTRIARVWATPGTNDRDATLMYLVNQTLVANKNAPLRKLLVDDLQLATAVGASPQARVVSGEYRLYIDLKPGVEPEEVLPHVDRVLAEFVADGPDEQLLANAKLAVNMAILGGLEQSSAIGALLAEGYLYSDDPLAINRDLGWLNDATPADVRGAAARWLGRHYYQLTVFPFPDFASAQDDVDRSRIPDVMVGAEDIRFPETQSVTLDNGVRLVVAERGSVPIVDVVIRVGSGETAAPPDAHALADFVFMLADKGTRKYDANELAAARDRIAMSGRLGASLEDSSYGYRILRSNLDESLELALETLRYPTFPDDELAKLQQQIGGWLATLQRAPSSAAGSLFTRVVYGEDSPMDAVWTPASLEQIERERLVDFHAGQVTPDNLTIYMIGDITLDEARDSVGRTFGKWRASGSSSGRPIGSAPEPAPRVILVDQPGAASSTVIAGHAIAPWSPDDAAALAIVNWIFGGSFESRLNMNLREDKAWSYGYRSGISSNRSGDQLLTLEGQVQADRTADAMREIRREFVEFASTRPPTDEEVSRARTNRIRSLPGQFTTNRGFLGSIVASDSYGLPFDYAGGRAERYAAVTRDVALQLARDTFEPEALSWVVVGDLSTIETAVRELDFGDVEVWDAFGNRVR